MVFRAAGGRVVFAAGLEGGVRHDSDKKCGKAAFLYLSHSAVVIPCESAPLYRTGKKEGDESDPPKKGVPLRPRIAALSGTPLSRPQGVALVLIYPCGKARKPPPRRGAESTETDL